MSADALALYLLEAIGGHADLEPCEGEPLRDLTDPFRRAVRDDDERERRHDRDLDPMAAVNAACIGGGG